MSARPRRSTPSSVLLHAAALSGAVIGVLQLLHRHVGEVHPLPPLLHWGRDALLALPLAVLAVVVARWAQARAGDQRPALSGALAGGAAFGVLSVPAGEVHERLFVAEHTHGAFLQHAAADGMTAWLLASATLLLLAVLPDLRVGRRGGVRRPLAVALGLALLGTSAPGLAPTASAAPVGGPADCTPDRAYDVAAIDLDIPYNRWGTRPAPATDPDGGQTNLDRNGMMFVLQADKAAVKNWDVPLNHVRGPNGTYVEGTDPAGGRRLRPRPLVLRANVNECVKITLKNELSNPHAGVKDPRVSMHPEGVQYDVQTSDGGNVGFNNDTTVGPGETQVYYWRAPAQEGLRMFRDQPGAAGGEADGGSLSHGLYGALAVEPAGSVWLDPVTGRELYKPGPDGTGAQSGELYVDAMIKPPVAGAAFRESIQLAQDEIPGIGFGFNYGAEPNGPREKNLCPDCVGEETSLSSWMYGDPALVKLASGKGPVWNVDGTLADDKYNWLPNKDAAKVEDCGLKATNSAGKQYTSCWTSNVAHAYPNDAFKLRYGLAGVKETHVFHMHAHQWLVEPTDNAAAGNPDDPNGNQRSLKVDSQTFGPGDVFTADLIGGAGSVPGTVGDSIFHCHLYPHFADGFWALMRVHDVRENGTGTTPDHINVRELQPLPEDATVPPLPSAGQPGFPRFIPGETGWRAPQPPLGISGPNGTADDHATLAREDLTPANRFVAGKVLDSSVLDKTQVITAAPSTPTVLTFGGRSATPTALTSADAVRDALLSLRDADGAVLPLDQQPIEAVTVTSPSDGKYAVRLDRWKRTDSLVIGTSPDATNVPDPALVGPDAARIAHQLMLEKVALAKAHADRNKGTAPQPGAPFVDPCPKGTPDKPVRTVTYNVSVIQRDIVYNEAGWHDTQGRLYVLDKDVEAVLSGAKDPEPLFIRVNAGDCINFNLTSYLPNWHGDDAFVELAQTNMVGGHIHLVKFDVLGSDGSSNGWNYQEAAFSKEQVDFNAAVAAGTKPCTPMLCRLTAPDPAYSPVGNGPTGRQGLRGQTIHERWYADSELRTVFTHDHHFPALMQNRGQFGALVVEPAGFEMRNPFDGTFYRPGTDCTAPDAPADLVALKYEFCNGDAVGPFMDLIGPGTPDDFREFGLAFQDFTSLTRPGGDPTQASDVFNPPPAQEHIPDEDPGVMGISYRNAPFLLRDTKNGAWVDPAYRFSSTVFGDPKTPLLQAYAGDKVRVRLIQGAQEEQNVWALHGMRWREEPDDPDSPLVNSKALGISDAPNFEIPRMTCDGEEDCKGDFLYSSTSTDATYLGMWGIMRVYGKGTRGLLPLPDNPVQNANGTLNFAQTGSPPQLAPSGKDGGAICPSSAPVKKFSVFATDGEIVYNRKADGSKQEHDPYGLMYGLVQPGETMQQAIDRVEEAQEPLVLRANAGDCLEVTLTNKIDKNGPFATLHAPKGAADGDPKLPLEPPTGTRAGLRVSLHPQVVRYDVRYSDGATVGFNRDQTVAPDQSILYRWWADEVTPGEIGATNLVDFGDLRGHRHHGLFAGLVIEPKGSEYRDPVSGQRVHSGAQADIRVPDPKTKDFREFVPFFQDGLNLRYADGSLVERIGHDGTVEAVDAEDEGEKGFNYRSPRFAQRGDPLRELPGATPATTADPITGRALADVFSSKTQYGDPVTPIFRAYSGDPVRMRVLQGADKPRQHSWQVAGQQWRSQAEDLHSTLVGTTGGISVSRTLDVHTTAGSVGDHRYNCGVNFHHLSGGLWGLMRVYDRPASTDGFTPSPMAARDDPHQGGNRPLWPLEMSSLEASVFDDTDRNRVKGNNERSLADVPVELRQANPDGTTGALIKQGRTDATGRVSFTVPGGAYDLVAPDRPDWAATTPRTMRLTASQDAVQSAVFGQVQLANLALRPYNDANGNLVVDAGEASMDGWTVTLAGQGTTKSATVASGVVAFGDLLPGDYSAKVTPGAGYYSTTHSAASLVVPVAENADLTGAKELRMGFALKAGVSVRVFNDSNKNGKQDPGESSLGGRRLAVKGGPEGKVLAAATTDAAGNAVLDDPDPAIEGLVPGGYELTETLDPGWSVPSAGRTVTRADGTTTAEESLQVSVATVTTGVEEKTSQVVTLRNHNPKGVVTAVPFNDLNNDGVRQDKESKLVGWRATLHDAATGAQLAETTTDSGGKAVFRVDTAGPVEAPVNYLVKMAPQEVSGTDIPWTSTTSGQVTVGAVSGEERAGGFGFVQLGTIGAYVWHDLDRDGVDSGRGEMLGDRVVRLYDAGGKTLLQQKVTDGFGRTSFKASAGVDYQLEVVLPTGWTATAPFAANGSAVTKLKVVGPSGITSDVTRFGQYNTADRIPPPTPVATATATTLGSQSVVLGSEANATFRYTLDGSVPSATTGTKYTGPIIISTTKTLTAVAVDGAGNASEVPLIVTYTIAGSTAAPAPPTAWTPITGTTRGDLAHLMSKDDGTRFYLTAVTSGASSVTDGYGSVMVPVGQRSPTGLSLALEGRASIAGVTRALEAYNWGTKKYEVLRAAEPVALTDERLVVDVAGDPKRFVHATTGELRMKVRASASKLFEYSIDQATLQVRY